MTLQRSGLAALVPPFLVAALAALAACAPAAPIDETPPITRLTSTPTALAVTSAATFAFESSEPGATFACAIDEAAAVPCTSPHRIDGLADGAHRFEVAATDAAGNVEQPPARFTWTIDTVAPETTFDAVPAEVDGSGATFAFSSDEPGTFECALDGADFAPCESPLALDSLGSGAHAFVVRSRDVAGHLDPTPASLSWTVDADPPVTTLSDAPPDSTERTAVFTFESEPDATFECRLDDAAFAPCESPHALEALGGGAHTFTVRATDVLGNVEATPPSRTWTVTGFERLRVVAANLSSGNAQSYDPGHGARILAGLDPDVVLIQELNYASNSASDVDVFVTQTFDASFDWYREGGAQIPNGIISRHPILASGEWDDPEVSNRDFAWARIDVPGPKDLWVVSVHFLTSSSGDRNAEATELVEYVRANVPEGDFLVVGGDLNTASRTESCLSTLAAVVTTSGPWPADANGNTNTNASRSKPYDWVLPDPDLAALSTPVVLGASTFEAGLVLDTRVYAPLSEIAPAQAGDSGASNMQHMAVVRDFELPLF